MASAAIIRAQRWQLTKQRALSLLEKYDENQPRDETGKWTSGGGGGGSTAEAKPSKFEAFNVDVYGSKVETLQNAPPRELRNFVKEHEQVRVMEGRVGPAESNVYSFSAHDATHDDMKNALGRLHGTHYSISDFKCDQLNLIDGKIVADSGNLERWLPKWFLDWLEKYDENQPRDETGKWTSGGGGGGSGISGGTTSLSGPLPAKSIIVTDSSNVKTEVMINQTESDLIRFARDVSSDENLGKYDDQKITGAVRTMLDTDAGNLYAWRSKIVHERIEDALDMDVGDKNRDVWFLVGGRLQSDAVAQSVYDAQIQNGIDPNTVGARKARQSAARQRVSEWLKRGRANHDSANSTKPQRSLATFLQRCSLPIVLQHALRALRREKQEHWEQQPRDEEGKWTSGGGGGGAGVSPFEGPSSERPARDPAHANAVLQSSRGVAKEMGMNPEMVSIGSADSPYAKFTLGGREREAYAVAHNTGPQKGQIEIFGSHMARDPNSPEVKGAMAHEVQHIKFQAALDRYETEREAIMSEPGAGTGPRDPVMNADGSLKPPYDEKYPAYTAMRVLSERETLLSLADADGVSDYSFDWWKHWKENPNMQRLSQATNETMAEMARIKYQTGSFPDHMGERILSWRGENEPKPSQAQIESNAKRWRDLYDAVDRIYKKQ